MLHRLTGADHGRMLRVAPGDEVVIELLEQATAGYEWMIDAVPGGVVAALDKLPPDGAAGVGAAAAVRVTLHVAIAPKGVVRLRHCQPWDPQGAVADVFELSLAP